MLFQPPAQESTNYVVSTVLDHGAGVTVNQLRRWRRLGLIPRSRQRGAGRGSVVIHPPGTGLQAVTVFRELWWERSEVRALWNLWWDRFPVDEKRLRSLLDGKIKQLSVLRDQLLTAGDGLPSEPRDIVDELGSCARARLKSKALGRLRRALRSERFAFLLHLLISVGVGLFDEWADLEEDPRVLIDAFKLEASPDRSQVERLSKLLEPDNLRRALESASTQELNEAKSRLSHVVKSLWFWLTPERMWNVEQRIGQRGAEQLSLVLNDLDFRGQVLPYLFLVTMAVSRTGNDEVFRSMLVGELPMGGWPLFIS